jgi:hypothetical protein
VSGRRLRTELDGLIPDTECTTGPGPYQKARARQQELPSSRMTRHASVETRGTGLTWDEATMKHTVVLALLLASAATAACKKSSEASPAEQQPPEHASMAGHPMTDITVGDHGFSPNHVELKKGEPAMLTFKRTSDATCAKAVVFPELGIKKPLPLNQPVTVQIPTDQARTIGFECGMGMYKSQIVVR